MELVSVALAFAILVVLIILWKCRKPKNGKKSKKSRGNYDAFSSAVTTNNDYATALPDRSNLPAIATSPTGSGALNITLDQQYNNLKSNANFGDYNAMMQYASLEPEVFASQASYVKEMTNSTSGASNMSVRDDPNDINPWVGIRGAMRDYQSVYADSTARVTPTEYADSMPAAKKFVLI